MSDFTYTLPCSEEKLKSVALDSLQKEHMEWATLLRDCKMSIEDHGTSYYYDNSRTSRWDALAIEIKFYVPSKNVDLLSSFPQYVLRKIFSDLIPSEVGYDIKTIKYIPNLSEESTPDIIEAIDATLESIKSTPFSQAVEHYQQAKRQLADATDERRRKDSVRDCASAMESIIKILGNADDIKIASKNLRSSHQWGIDEIVKDGDGIFNTLHRLYPDLRHGALETSSMSVNEARYWIDRISTYISYMIRLHEDVSLP